MNKANNQKSRALGTISHHSHEIYEQLRNELKSHKCTLLYKMIYNCTGRTKESPAQVFKSSKMKTTK